MKILFLATYFPRPLNSRIGPWALDQAKAFAEQGATVRVLSMNPWFPRFSGKLYPSLRAYSNAPKSMRYEEVEVFYPNWGYYPFSGFEKRLGSQRWRWMDLAWKGASKNVMKLARSFRPDLIYAHHTLVNGFLAARLAPELGVPFLTTDHEIGDILNTDKRLSQKRTFESVSAAASATIAVSKTMEAAIAERFPNAKTATIYNGGGFETLTEDVLDKPSRKGEPMRIFCCANFYGRKDIPLLVRAFDIVAQKHPDLHLRIAGSGPDESNIRSALAESTEKARIELLGSINKDQVMAEMAAADIFCLPGWAEPFGVVFIEAMSAGCALVLSEDAGVAEVLKNDETALFTRPRDLDSVVAALETLANNPEKIQRVGTAAFTLFHTKLSWSNAARNYLRHFKSILEMP